jgi:hypothetical protein
MGKINGQGQEEMMEVIWHAVFSSAWITLHTSGSVAVESGFCLVIAVHDTRLHTQPSKLLMYSL